LLDLLRASVNKSSQFTPILSLSAKFFDASIPASLRFIIFSFSPFGIELLFKLLLTLIINYWHISLEYEFDIIVDKINIIKNIVFIIFPHFVKQIAGE